MGNQQKTGTITNSESPKKLWKPKVPPESTSLEENPPISHVNMNYNPPQNVQNVEKQQPMPQSLPQKEIFVCQKVVDYNQNFLARFRLAHQNLLRTLGFDMNVNYFQSNDQRVGEYIYFEYAPKSIKSLLNDRKPNKLLSDNDMRVFIKDMINVLSFLQENGISHGDLDSSTIFFDETQEIFKIYDHELLAGSNSGFGLTKQMVKTSLVSPEFMMAFIYQPSLVFLQGNYFKSDVFSLGMVFLEVGCLRDSLELYDFQNIKINQQGMNERLTFMSQYFSNEVVNLIAMMLEFEESKRPDFLQLKMLLIQENLLEQEYGCFDNQYIPQQGPINEMNNNLEERIHYIDAMELSKQREKKESAHQKQGYQQVVVPQNLNYYQQPENFQKIQQQPIKIQNANETNSYWMNSQNPQQEPQQQKSEKMKFPQQYYDPQQGIYYVKKEVVEKQQEPPQKPNMEPVYYYENHPSSQYQTTLKAYESQDGNYNSSKSQNEDYHYGELRRVDSANMKSKVVNEASAQNFYNANPNLMQMQIQNPNMVANNNFYSQSPNGRMGGNELNENAQISQNFQDNTLTQRNFNNHQKAFSQQNYVAPEKEKMNPNYNTHQAPNTNFYNPNVKIENSSSIQEQNPQIFLSSNQNIMRKISAPVQSHKNQNIVFSNEQARQKQMEPQNQNHFQKQNIIYSSPPQQRFVKENEDVASMRVEDKETKESLERLRMEILNSKKIIDNYEKNKKESENKQNQSRKPFNEMTLYGNMNTKDQASNFKVESTAKATKNNNLTSLKNAHYNIIERNKKLDERLEEVLRKSQAITKGLK